MKKSFLMITMIVILVVTMFCTSGCSSNNSEKVENEGLVVISTQVIDDILGEPIYLATMYDSDTLVMYSVTYRGSSFTKPSQLTPLYNADGTLKTYTPNAD